MTNTNLTPEKVEQLLEAHPMFKSFRKYFNMEQEGKNDYEVGCIQTANALMPVILELLIAEK